MNEKLRELLDFPELGPNDDRSGEAINRGFAMLLVPSVFKDFANDRINLSKQKKEASDRQLALKKAEKKRAEERKKIIDDAACQFFDEQHKIDIENIDNEESEAIDKLKTLKDTEIEKLNKGTKSKQSASTQSKKAGTIKSIESTFKAAVKLLKESYSATKRRLQSTYKAERKVIIATHNLTLMQNGARDIALTTNIDITDTAMNDYGEDITIDTEGEFEDEGNEFDDNNDPNNNDDAIVPFNEVDNDPYYFKCNFANRHNIRCPRNYWGLCDLDGCKYSKIELCSDCLRTHTHVDDNDMMILL